MEDSRPLAGGDARDAGQPLLDRRAVLGRIREAVARATDRDDRLHSAVRILADGVPKYTWTGIYLLEGDTLVLHNQVGQPTPHERIPVGQGICGLAVTERKTVVVPDVGENPRYLACSHETRSEIVVPIFCGGEVVGEIDIDSNLLDAFDEEDRILLEETARLLGAAD